MLREQEQVFLTEEELCGAILHYLKEKGPVFSIGFGDGIKVCAAPIVKKQGRFDFVVTAAPVTPPTPEKVTA